MNRCVTFLCVMLCALSSVQVAGASTVDANLSLVFNNPADIGSGGTWTVSALAGNFGLAGIVFDLLPSNFSGNFLISNTIFEIQNAVPDGTGTGFSFAIGDDLATPTLNVGVGAYVGLVSGTFSPGNFPPAFANVGANFFDASGGVFGVLPSDLTTSLTTNLIPEPSALTLCGLALLGTGFRRRSRG